MVIRFKTLFMSVSVVGMLFVGKWTVSYFTHGIPPEFSVEGLEKEGNYKDIINCVLTADNGYNLGKVTATLDGKPFSFDPSARFGASFEHEFIIDSTLLDNGEHTLMVEAVDSSYNQNMRQEQWRFTVDNAPLKAVFLLPQYTVLQGRTLHAQIRANKTLDQAHIRFKSGIYECYPESENSMTYECFIPIDCEELCKEEVIGAEVKDLVGNKMAISSKAIINEYTFKKQGTIKVSSDKMEEEKEVSINSKVLEEALEKWVKDSPKKKLWSGAFDIPVEVQRISTTYGEIRTTPEKGRYMHKAVDLVNRPQSVIWASQDGKVIIKDRYLMSGNTVVVDHGLGVFTLYYHLDNFADIEVGDVVKKGNPLGRLGKTGYATGYHLHWELRVNNTCVDPLQWTKKNF